MTGRNNEIFCYGESMRRAFDPGETLRLEPIRQEEVKVGDVIAVRYGETPVAHRVIRRLPDGALVTMGDNNNGPDGPQVRPEDEVFLVTAHLTDGGRRWRPVRRGMAGMAEFALHRFRRCCRHLAGRMLRPLFRRRWKLKFEAKFRDFELYGSKRFPGSVRVMKDGRIKWQRTWMQFFYELPKNKNKETR